MAIVYVALFLLVLLGVAYCARLLRSLHTKVGRETEKILREHNKLASEIKKNSMMTYQQIEAYIQLNSLLDFESVVPSTRSWAASPDLLLTITQTIKKINPELVVELGSGVSTLVAAKAGARKIISIDNSEIFGDQTRQLLKAHQVHGVEIRIAQLFPDSNGLEWYDMSVLQDLEKIDLLIIDGPPGSKNSEARYPALKAFKGKLSANATIIIDDVKRDGERKLAEDFAKALPNHELVILDHEKGTAIISPR